MAALQAEDFVGRGKGDGLIVLLGPRREVGALQNRHPCNTQCRAKPVAAAVVLLLATPTPFTLLSSLTPGLARMARFAHGSATAFSHHSFAPCWQSLETPSRPLLLSSISNNICASIWYYRRSAAHHCKIKHVSALDVRRVCAYPKWQTAIFEWSIERTPTLWWYFTKLNSRPAKEIDRPLPLSLLD